MKFIFSIFCFCLFVANLNCQSVKMPVGFSAPIVITDNRPFIQVKIKNQTFHFVIDTGGYNLIDLKAAQKLGLELTDQSQTGGAGEQRVDVWTTNLAEFSIGEKTFTDQKFNVLSLKNIKDGLNLPYLDGVIGFDFFGNGVLQIDYPNNKVNFLNSYQGKNGVPFTIYGSHIPKIKVKIDGIESEFIMDTGDRSNLTLSKHFADEILKNTLYEISSEKITGYGIGGPIWAKTFELKRLSFADRTENNILTRIPNVKSGGFAQSSFFGSIGSGLLIKYKITLDYQNKLIYFE